MSLRTRVTIAAGAIVVAIGTATAFVLYPSVSNKLHEQIDASLIEAVARLPQTTTTPQGAAGRKALAAGRAWVRCMRHHGIDEAPPGQLNPPDLPPPDSPVFKAAKAACQQYYKGAQRGRGDTLPISYPAAKPGDAVGFVQLLKSTAKKAPTNFLPVSAHDRAVARGLARPYFASAHFRGKHLRVYTARLSGTPSGLVRTTRPLTEVDATLHDLTLLLVGLIAGGGLLACLIGRFAAARVLRPVSRLSQAVENVRATGDLGQRLDVDSRDEVGRLATAFKAMMAALDQSQRAQQQLIADASHELRTPLTAHRTNIELLARADLPPERRSRLLAQAVETITTLSNLVNDLVEAARDGVRNEPAEEIHLDALVAEAVRRAQTLHPDVRFTVESKRCTVRASPTRLERALANILDNAAKWSLGDAPVEVMVADGVVTVRDHGPGIGAGDLPHVFDRFYRAPAARGRPGSGLGLAIVRQTAEAFGGSVEADNAEGGGALIKLRLPTVD